MKGHSSDHGQHERMNEWMNERRYGIIGVHNTFARVNKKQRQSFESSLHFSFCILLSLPLLRSPPMPLFPSLLIVLSLLPSLTPFLVYLLVLVTFHPHSYTHTLTFTHSRTHTPSSPIPSSSLNSI
ncbi:MAG: hypothetical protein JOS17DRAFT_530326 [Linnemannia elongata]|nr:MAG: hypothetical protein JOS17DRAFT_530326 [Linnemannia elongata]